MKKTILFLLVAVMITVTSLSSDISQGGYVGQTVSDFISNFESLFNVVNGVISLNGNDYQTYDVFENDDLLFQVGPFPSYYDDKTLTRIWIYSPQIKTEKGIGIGNTYAEMKTQYTDIYSSFEGGMGLWIEGLSAFFSMGGEVPENYTWEDIPENFTIQQITLVDNDVMITTDKRIMKKESFEIIDTQTFGTEVSHKTNIKTAEDLMRLYYTYEESEEGNQKLSIETVDLSDGRYEVTLIHEGLLDDSMYAVKIVMTASQIGTTWTVEEIKRNWKCRQGRGHQNWGIELCR
ncbi:MAG: hypothetical protein FWG98_03615 [Candidatus Cloacimonetes bacterium]|nr:hypothetical protein [Candidatus Cloacimonadota bacterium]